MKEINIISGEQKLNGEKIRYIELDKQKYVIYTLNEIDDDGYEKLYINKFVDNEEDLISDISWEELKNEIPNIVKQIRNNDINSFKDLNLDEIGNVNIKYSRPFKLKVSIVDSIKKDDVKLDTELNNLLGEISSIDNNNNYKETKDNNLDKFLEDIDKKEINEQSKIERTTTESELEIEQLNEELNRQKQTNELLQNKIIELEIELSNYKKKLNDIKIMIEQS